EHGSAGNNTLIEPVQLTLALPSNPDLQVQSATAPATAQAGGTVSVTFTVKNQGTVTTTVPHWQDSVYLSQHNTLDNSATLLGTFNNQSALDPGATYQTQTG